MDYQRKVNNVFDAISSGAIDMAGPIAAIVSNVIAFVSIFSFLDAICRWVFGMLLLKNFELAVSLVFKNHKKIIF
jgi:nucleoside permease NupC